METLRDLRKQNGKTCAEVAQALGVAIQTAYRYEQGERRISLEQVLILKSLYGVSAEEVIDAQLNSCRNDQ